MIDFKGLDREKFYAKLSIWFKKYAVKHITAITWAFLVCNSIRYFD
jgi:hypothetical protein